jgi:hypothetical protein
MGATLRLYDIPVTKDPAAAACTATNFAYYWDEGTIKPLSDLISGTPEVTIANNKLTIKLDAPKPAALVNLVSGFYAGTIDGTNITATPADAKSFDLWIFYESAGDYYLNAHKTWLTEQVMLIYVDKTVTINGSNVVGSSTDTFTNVTLQAGWNYLFMTRTGSSPNYTYTFTAGRTLPAGYNVPAVTDV